MGRESDSKGKKRKERKEKKRKGKKRKEKDISQPYLFESNRLGVFVLLMQSAQNKLMTEFSVCRHWLNLNKHWFRALTLMLVRCTNLRFSGILCVVAIP